MASTRVNPRGPTVGSAATERALHTSVVVTPEAVYLSFRTAGIGSRVLARSIDAIIQLLLIFILLIPIAFLGVLGSAGPVIGWIVMVFVVMFGYPVSEAFMSGQTVGKKMLGLRVVTTEGGPIQFRHAAIRTVIGLAEFFVIPGGLLAVTTALVSRRGQRLGDLAAGALVVRVERERAQPVFFPPVQGHEHFSFQFDAGGITPAQYLVLRDFMVRYNEMGSEAANRLATRLAADLQISGATSRPPNMSFEHYLMVAVFAYQQRFQFDDGTKAAPIVPLRSATYGEGYSTAAPPPPMTPPPPPRFGQPGTQTDWWGSNGSG